MTGLGTGFGCWTYLFVYPCEATEPQDRLLWNIKFQYEPISEFISIFAPSTGNK